ncbi:MAG: phenylalanine--tRNA ligase subunit beta, partial [bacterium]
MLVPLSWLRDFVHIDISPDELAKKLSGAGVPVEQVEVRNRGIRGVVAGKITSLIRHPQADKLMVAQVDTGKETLQIITGASNVREGDLIPLALDGAVLAGGQKIKATKLRGLPSAGMMCSAVELDLDLKDLPEDQRTGVMILPPSTEVGLDVARAFGHEDVVFHLETFANRPDHLSIAGIAREVAGLLGEKINMPPPFIEEEGMLSNNLCPGMVSVSIEAPQACSRYIARVIENIAVGPSPLWMQGRLIAAGVRVINNIVDTTNYIMLETGQPLHAFDYDLIEGHSIRVRWAGEGEKILCLDGEERSLSNWMLVIADEKRPVALAGVMGGLESEVSEKTRTVLLEAAIFNPATIRRTSQFLALKSESSKRFEKGLDFHGAALGSERATTLMLEMGGRAARGCVDVGPPQPRQTEIVLRPARLNALLGTGIPPAEIHRLLQGMGFGVSEAGSCFTVSVPSSRADLKLEVDLIEEVARLHGYDNIPSTLPEGRTLAGRTTLRDEEEERARDILSRIGLYEAMTMGLGSPAGFERLKVGENALTVKNPLVEDQRVLRPTLWAHHLEVVSRNARLKNPGVWMYEIARVYGQAPEFPIEKRQLCITLAGERNGMPLNFFMLKGILEALFEELGLKVFFAPASHPSLHPGITASIRVGAQEVGICGMLHPLIASETELPEGVFLAEMNFDLMTAASPGVVEYQPLPKHPAVVRDLALVVPEEVLSGD